MHKVATIGIAIGALSVAALPVRADDQAIGLATGQLGASWWSAPTDNQQARAAPAQRRAIQRTEPFPQVSSEAYAAFGLGGAYLPICSYIGGPKGASSACR
jgi:hypothetical protein